MTAQPSSLVRSHEQVRDFYLSKVDGAASVFEIWERGDAYGDSITPSIYSADYRSWMTFCLRNLLGLPGERRLVSIGCGNAAVEADLHRAGHRVFALDLLPDAVEFARRKGVEAVVGDVMSWRPSPADNDSDLVVYADGLVGHLYDEEEHTLPVLGKVREWFRDSTRGALVVSNDEATDYRDVQDAAGVPGFHWFSREYLVSELRAAGFTDVYCTSYAYERPLSGIRCRLVVVARP